ncbi:MAG: hypothetical protein JJU29_05810 [Verrucomicrobia bacterium]|nr:hypothetical protein [Verrucomicrobiota bacterium]MCH8510682.1 hypothetical protein [Kiritimatiellia bacterium]
MCAPTKLFALLVGLSLQAEETASIRFFAPPVRGILTEGSEWESLPTRLQVGAEPNAQSVSLHRNGYSREIQVPKGRPLPLYTSAPGSEDSLRSLGELSPIPEEWDRVIVLLASGISENAEQIDHELIDFSKASVPIGSHTFQNNLDNPVEVRAETDKLFVEPGKRVTWEGESDRVRVNLVEIDGSRGRRFTGAVHGSPQHGTLHLIQKNPRSPRRINFTSLSMEAPVPEEPEAPPSEDTEEPRPEDAEASPTEETEEPLHEETEDP